MSVVDWLANLVQGVHSNAGLKVVIDNQLQHPNENLFQGTVRNAGDIGGQLVSELGHPVGSAFGMAVSADPSQIVTRPIAHLVGAGDTQWDTGLLGMTGNAFDKVGRLATYIGLTGTEGHALGLPNASDYNRRAWDMAFSGSPDHILFGEAMLANESVVTNPNGLANLRHDIEGTWYGQTVSGALDFALYAAIDPTRGVGKAAEAARAASYVADASKADKLATAANTALDAGEALPKPNVAQRLTLGSKLSDRAVAGYQWEAKARLDNVTDVNQIINEIDPRIGTGGGATKGAIPGIAEMYADASKITSDVNLQRQIKLNIDYALTGSSDAMTWLADNYPGIAAKGRRMSGAPSEFTLLEDVMSDYAANGSTGGFNLGDHVRRHYSDPAQQAELISYGQRVERLQKFRSAILEGGPEGGAVEFGTTKYGVQVAPRNLEKLKTAINNKVGDEYLFQDGATGRTSRIITSLTTPGAHGFINLVDPVLGNRQLVYTMKEFAQQVDGVDSNLISQVSGKFLSLDPAGRERFVREVNDHMLTLIANQHGLKPHQVEQLLTESTMAYRDGRKYALDEAVTASKRGDTNVNLGDVGGTDTYLDAQHLISHLSENVGLFDYKTAESVVKSYKEGGSRVSAEAGDFLLRGISTYHTMWKHAQLGRFGLIFRVLMDTDLRANAMIGTSALMMEALNGAANFAKNAYATRTGSVLDEAVSSMAFMQANEVRRASGEIAAESTGELTKAKMLHTQIARADELADLFKSRQRQGGKFHSQTTYYKAQEAKARALAARLRSDQHAVGNPEVPTGLKSLQESRNALEPARFGAQKALASAEEHYLTPEPYKLSNSSQRKTHEYNGVQVRASMVENDMERALLPDEVRGGKQGLSSLLLNDMDTHTWQGRVEANHWQGHVEPDDVNWEKKYAISMQEMRDSYTMRRLLVEGEGISEHTPAAILRSFMDDPQVRAEFKAITGGGTKEEFTRWLGDLNISVDSMTKNPELKAALLDSKVLTPDEVRAIVPNEEDRFPIFGPNVVNDRQRNFGKRALDRFYRSFVDLPDVYLARIPAAVGLYHKNIDYLLPSYAEKALGRGRNYLLPEEARDLHLRAKGRALNDARRDMYDIHRRLGSEGVMRYIAPFFAPWYDAIQSWARLIYDDPSRFGQLMRYANAPDMFNLTTDPEGNPVRPWDDTPLQDKTINVPLFGIGGLESYGVNFGSMNTITQGNTPFSPGAGPLAQVAGTVLVGRVAPKVFDGAIWTWMQENPDNIISQSLFMRPGDVPKADLKTVVGSQLPSYMRTMSDAFLGSDGFGNTYTNAYGTRYNDLVRQYREDHGGDDPSPAALKQIDHDADMGARAAAIARSAVSFNLGLSGTAVPEGQFYMDKMHALTAVQEQLHAAGTTPEQVFAANYPTAANLNWSFSENNGHLQATVNATTAYVRHRNLMDDHPDVMWWIAGPDNIVSTTDPNNEFSQGAYNQQMTAGLRRKFGRDDLVKQSQIAMGQGRLNAFNNALRLYMAQNGIKSLNAKNAGNLSVLRAQYMDQLRAQFPSWAEYYDKLNSPGEQKREIEQIRSAMQAGGSALQNRPDVRLTQQYLAARDAVIAQAQAQGVVGWQNANAVKTSRDVLFAYGESLARRDVVFAQAWDRLFSHEFNYDLRANEQAQLAAQVGPNGR